MTKVEQWEKKGWAIQDCSCHRGVVPDYDNGGGKDCLNCRGVGTYWLSPKGRIADYPGGPFRGQISKIENALFRTIRKPTIATTERDIKAIHLVPRYSAGGMYPMYEYRVEYY